MGQTFQENDRDRFVVQVDRRSNFWDDDELQDTIEHEACHIATCEQKPTHTTQSGRNAWLAFTQNGFSNSLLPRFVLLSFLFVPGLLHDELHKPRVNWRGSHDSRYVNVEERR